MKSYLELFALHVLPHNLTSNKRLRLIGALSLGIAGSLFTCTSSNAITPETAIMHEHKLPLAFSSKSTVFNANNLEQNIEHSSNNIWFSSLPALIDYWYYGQSWSWPGLRPAAVLNAFNPPAKRWLAGNRGVDLAHEIGAPVYAMESGQVYFSGRVANVNAISIKHGEIRSTYTPVKPIVDQDELVSKGQLIGYLEPGRNCVRSCLHIGVINSKSEYLDPMHFLKRVHIRLYDQNRTELK